MNDNFEDFVRKLLAAYAAHATKARYCQRCETKRTGADFPTPVGVCTECLESMPESELIWLHEEHAKKKGH